MLRATLQRFFSTPKYFASSFKTGFLSSSASKPLFSTSTSVQSAAGPDWQWGVRMWMPNIPIYLKTNYKRHSKQLVMATRPNVTKFEIKQYLQKLYGLDVKKVNTANVEGKIRPNRKKRGVFIKKTADYKKVYVSLAQHDWDQAKDQIFRGGSAAKE